MRHYVETVLFTCFNKEGFKGDFECSNPVGTRYCGFIGFLLDLHRGIDQLRFEIEVILWYDIFFQHHNDVIAITYRNVKLEIIVIPIFNVILISDKDENAINKGKHVVLFHLSKYSDKLYGNIVYKIQIEMSNFIKVPASLVFAAISEFWFLGFSKFTMHKLTIAVTAFLIAFLIKRNKKKSDQIIFHALDNLMIFHVQSYFVLHMWSILEHP